MKLYFLRHGIAADREEWKGDDYDRPLTAEGRERMLREAKSIEKLGLDVDVILTSPLVRAKQTAEIVADRLDLRDRLVEDKRLGGDFGPEAVLHMLQERAKAKNIMFVGHDPSMTDVIGYLTGGTRIDFKKGGLACIVVIEAATLSGRLLWLLTPKILTL